MFCIAGATLLGAAQADPAQQRLDELLAEAGRAQQEQDHARLRTIYAEIAALQPANPEVQRGLGLACYLQGDFDTAIQAFERAASLQPDLAGVRLYLGISYYRKNRFSEALSELEQAPELLEDDPTARYWQGAAYRALGRLSEAIRALEAARAKTGTNLEVLELLARAYAEHSSVWFRRLMSVAGESPSARLLKAEELVMDGAEHAALKELDAALDENPRLGGLHRLKGQILWSREEYENGAEEYRLELENDPFSVEAHIRLGAYLLDVGDPSAALGHLRLAQRNGPAHDRVGELLDEALRAGGTEPTSQSSSRGPAPVTNPTLEDGRDAYGRGEASQAAQLLEAVLTERPGSTAARRILARCYLAEGRMEPAATQLQEILASTEDDPEALLLMGRIYESLAAQTIEQLFELSPDSPGVRLLRGESFERGPRYEFERALAEFRKARDLTPADPAAHHALGRVLFKMKRFDEAIPHLEATLGINREHGMANYLLGKIRLLQGDRPGAIESLGVAVKARPGLADAQRDLARALVLEGRYDEGIQLYNALLDADATDTSLHALLAAAYRRAGRMQEAKLHAEKARVSSAR